MFPKLVFLAVSLYIVSNQVILATQDDWDSELSNKSLDLCFKTRENQTGHYISKWTVNKQSTNLPKFMKIDIKSSTTEHRGMQSIQLQVEISVPPPKPATYELFPGIGYYKFYDAGAMTYYQASATCTGEGGHLAIINSESEAQVIKMLYAKYPKAKEWAYIGFNDLDAEGKYVTIYGEPLEFTGYLQWYKGEPDQGEGNEDCGSIHRTGGLNDLWCDKNGPWPFICEYDLSWDE